MIRAIALKVGAAAIRINNINPDVIDTPMLQNHGEDVPAAVLVASLRGWRLRLLAA